MRRAALLLLSLAAPAPAPAPVSSAVGLCLPSNWTETRNANRTGQTLVLEADNWETHVLVTQIAAILIEETLGVPVKISEHPGGAALYARVTSGAVDANLEVWRSSKMDARALSVCTRERTSDCAVEGLHDFSGNTAMSFAAPAAGWDTAGLDLDFWRRYMDPATAPMQAMPPANFTAPGKTRLGCTTDLCSADGRFYPTVCGGDPTGMGGSGDSDTAATAGCKAYFHAASTWDEGLVEAAIQAKGLQLVVSYVGSGNIDMADWIDSAHAAGHSNALFYHWSPSIMLAGSNYQHVHIPMDESFCANAWGKGEYKCTPGVEVLTKLYSSRLVGALPAPVAFLDAFKLSDAQVNQLLLLHPAHNDSVWTTPREGACSWLRDNEDTWAPWVNNARSVEEGALGAAMPVEEAATDAPGLLVVVVVVGIGGVCAIVMTGLFLHSVRTKKEARELQLENAELVETQSKQQQLINDSPRNISIGQRTNSMAQLPVSSVIDWSELEIMEELGRGGFGAVFKGRFRGSDVAIKTIHRNELEMVSENFSGSGSGTGSGPSSAGSDAISIEILEGTPTSTPSKAKTSSSSRGSGGSQNGSGDGTQDSKHNTDGEQSVGNDTDATSGDKSSSSERDELLRRTSSERDNFRQEMMLLSELRHPNCIMLMGACKHNSDYVLVTEFMKGGSLADVLRSNSSAVAEMKVKLSIMLDCAEGLSYLHHASPAILHCDLKPANILLDEDYRHAKIADFGLSKGAGMDGMVGVGSVLGTVMYAAPEVLGRRGAQTASDIYSFGIVMWEIFTTRLPFGHIPGMQEQASLSLTGGGGATDEVAAQLASQITDTGAAVRPSITDDDFPEEYVSLLTRCWANNPDARPTVTSVIECLKAMLSEGALAETVVRRKHEWEQIPFADLERRQLLGVGAEGQVHAALWNGNECAIKNFGGKEQTFHTELNVMHRLRHPNILNFFGVAIDETGPQKRYCIVLERCACSLYQQLVNYGKLDNNIGKAKLNLTTRVRYALDSAKGMVFLHAHSIIHHDLKSSNLLIANDRAKTVKICDFSLSNLNTNSIQSRRHESLQGEGVGTPGWMSPEELDGSVVTHKSDVYSFALFLWELLHSSTPFAELLRGNISGNVQKLRMEQLNRDMIRPEVDDDLREWFECEEKSWRRYCTLMEQCWSQSAEARPEFTVVQKELNAIRKDLMKAGGVNQEPSPKVVRQQTLKKGSDGSNSAKPATTAGSSTNALPLSLAADPPSEPKRPDPSPSPPVKASTSASASADADASSVVEQLSGAPNTRRTSGSSSTELKSASIPLGRMKSNGGSWQSVSADTGSAARTPWARRPAASPPQQI